MIKPYTAVGLIPTVRGIRTRKDIRLNLEHLRHLVKAAAWLSSLDLPVRLIALPEGALQGFNDEVLDLDHAKFAREGAIDIPGEETEALGRIARDYDAFVIAQAKARHPDWKDRFFNVGFILDPRGRVVLKHYKVSPLFPVEHSVCPRDRPARDHDGQRGVVPGERPCARAERGRGRLPRLVPAPGHRQRDVRDPEPGPRARQ
jgi:predicted amidohydrolase